MIFNVIAGGTGNQMFEYAMIRSMAYDLDIDFSMCLVFYKVPNFILKKFFWDQQKHDRYSMNHFNIKENFISTFEFSKLLISGKIGHGTSIICEWEDFENFSLKNDISADDDILIRGGFMNENYFKHNHELIRNDFEVKIPPSERNKQLIDEISSSNSVALCIRRGDRLNPYSKLGHGICTLDYFKRAIDIINEKVENPVFYVFSNDAKWVRENIRIDSHVVYVDHNGVDEDYEDLRLMTHCKHLIISNSTFHWWGAWLNLNNDKVVIAPEPWEGTYNYDTGLDDWVKCKCDRSELYNQSSTPVFENENIVFNPMDKIRLTNSIGLLKGVFLENDMVMKLTINSEKEGDLRITAKNVQPSVPIKFFRGESVRYIVFDKSVPLSSVMFKNISDGHVDINVGAKLIDKLFY